MPERTASVEGIAMRWVEQGDGLPVVLIHGIPTCPALWRNVIPRLTGARCLAWEMVGYGASIPEGRGRDISVSAQADYLAAWLDSLGLHRVILAGHDLGGGVAQIAASRHSGLVSGLFLTNAIGYDSWPVPSVKAMRAAGPLVRHLPNSVFRQVVRTFIAQGHDDNARAEDAFKAHWPHYERADGAGAFIRQVNALDVRDTLSVADRLPQLGVPARLVWGAADQLQKIEYGERFARDLNAPLRRIEGGKHFTPEDHPDIVAEEIDALLDETRRSSPKAGGAEEPGDDRDRLRSAVATVRSLPEVMAQDAEPTVSRIYEDIQATLRVPFVNQVFRLLANEPAYLEDAWGYAGPIARTRAFEEAAKALRAEAQLDLGPQPAEADWEALGDLDRVRRFTDSIHYVLPKLLLLMSILDPKSCPAAAPTVGPRGTIPTGIAEGTEKIEMVDPNEATEAVRDIFEDILNQHRHPAVATYFRSLGQWPDLLQAIWAQLRQYVGSPAYEARRAALIERAAELAASLRAEAEEDTEPPAPPEDSSAVLVLFRQRVIPDLLLDVTLAKALLHRSEAAGASRFDVV